MKAKKWPLLTLIGTLIIAGGVLLFKDVPLLLIENLDRPAKVGIVIGASEPFLVFYIHSIYDEPVTEEFEARAEEIILKGVRTRGPGVMEYYGFETKEGVHAVRKSLGKSFVMKRGPRKDQGVLVKGRRILLSEIAEEGERVRLGLKRIPLGIHLLYRLFGES